MLRELEVLIFDGFDIITAVEQLKAAHALDPRDPSVNVHLHEALDQRCAELCGLSQHLRLARASTPNN